MGSEVGYTPDRAPRSSRGEDVGDEMKIGRQQSPAMMPTSERPSTSADEAQQPARSNAELQESLKAVRDGDDYRDVRKNVGEAVRAGADDVASRAADAFGSPKVPRTPITMKYGILPMGPEPGKDGCPPLKLEDRIRPFESSLGPGPPTIAMMYGIAPIGQTASVQSCPPILMKYGIKPQGMDLPPAAPVIMAKYGIMPTPSTSGGGGPEGGGS